MHTTAMSAFPPREANENRSCHGILIFEQSRARMPGASCSRLKMLCLQMQVFEMIYGHNSIARGMVIFLDRLPTAVVFRYFRIYALLQGSAYERKGYQIWFCVRVCDGLLHNPQPFVVSGVSFILCSYSNI
jgi:hypothetical protein